MKQPHSKKQKITNTLLIALLLACGSTASAATATVSFDFGMGPGRVNAADSGFLIDVGSEGRIEAAADALVLTAGERRFQNLSFLQGFVGMRASDGYDFVVTMRTTVQAFAGSNNRRWGIHLFAGEDLEQTGVCAMVIGNNADKNRQLIIRNGLSGEDIASAAFAADGFSEGDQYTFSVSGDYVGEADLHLTFTLADGVNTNTVTATVNRNDYPGILTGGSARLRDGWAIAFHSLTITIP
jgi:hypothetical protein